MKYQKHPTVGCIKAKQKKGCKYNLHKDFGGGIELTSAKAASFGSTIYKASGIDPKAVELYKFR